MMNQLQFEAITRQATTAIGMLFVTYSVTGNAKVDAAVAIITAVATLAWSFFSKKSSARSFKVLSTLTRKVIQAVPAFLVTFELANASQATAWTAVAFSVVTAWDMAQKK
jgi:hypothetical protein